MFWGLKGETKDLVTNLSSKAKPLTYIDFHSYLLIFEFFQKSSLQLVSSAITTPLFLTPTYRSLSFLHIDSALNHRYIIKVLVATIPLRIVAIGQFYGGWIIIITITIMGIMAMVHDKISTIMHMVQVRILGNKVIDLGNKVTDH